MSAKITYTLPEKEAKQILGGIELLHSNTIDEVVVRGYGFDISLYPTYITYEDGTRGVIGVRALFHDASEG